VVKEHRKVNEELLKKMKDQTDSMEILNNKIAEFLDFQNKNECEKMGEKKEVEATIEREILEI
jgi:hypothetical protein